MGEKTSFKHDINFNGYLEMSITKLCKIFRKI